MHITSSKRASIGVVVHRSLLPQIFSADDLRRLSALGDVTFTTSESPLSVSDACELLENCEIGVGSWRTPFPCNELLEKCPNLRLWEHAAGTVKYMFGSHLDGRNLTIASCKTAIAEDVAEITFGELIVGLRQIVPNAVANRAGITPAPPTVRVLSRSTIGLVGASEVGRRVALRLKATGCRTLIYDPFLSAEVAQELGAELVESLTSMCAECDAVSIHTPNIPACRKQIGAEQFAAMRDDTILVNTARGQCIDEVALVKELEKGRLFAFLDVSDPEPPPADSPLRSLPNVVYTSHIAGGPSQNIGRQAVDDIEAFIKGEKPLCVVTQDQLEITA